MINSNTMGLKVDNTLPQRFKTKVDVNTQVEITFNSELDTGSIIGNIFILEDRNFIYKEDNNVNMSLYVKVDGNLTYKDKTIIFVPKNQLNINSQYLIYIPKNSLRDVLGKTLLVDFISIFSTEAYESIGKCEIINPLCNSTLKELTNITLQDLHSDKYLIQLSKIKTFDNIILEEVYDSNVIDNNFNIGDGLYYIRAKALNGMFGETCVVTIKTHENTIPTDQDLDEDYIWEEYSEAEHGLVETFPNNDSHAISEKTNIIYMKFKGMVDMNDIDFYESIIEGIPSDDDTDIKAHGEIDGTFTVVQDEENSETYVFFIPNSL